MLQETLTENWLHFVTSTSFYFWEMPLLLTQLTGIYEL